MDVKEIKEILEEWDMENAVQIEEHPEALAGFTHDYALAYDATKLPDDFNLELTEEEGKLNPVLFTPCKSTDLPDDVIVLSEDWWNTAIIGLTDTNQAVYDYDKMVDAYVDANGEDGDYDDNYTPDTAAVEWIDYNVIRALPYYPNHPIIVTNIERYL